MLKILKLDILKNLKSMHLGTKKKKKRNPIWPSCFLLKVNMFFQMKPRDLN